MATSGIGASDIVAATVGGATYGLALLWALAIGAFFKFVLSEGLARWQLATGSTALEGWARQLPRWVMVLFASYLVLWAVAVSGALISGAVWRSRTSLAARCRELGVGSCKRSQRSFSSGRRTRAAWRA